MDGSGSSGRRWRSRAHRALGQPDRPARQPGSGRTRSEAGAGIIHSQHTRPQRGGRAGLDHASPRGGRPRHRWSGSTSGAASVLYRYSTDAFLRRKLGRRFLTPGSRRRSTGNSRRAPAPSATRDALAFSRGGARQACTMEIDSRHPLVLHPSAARARPGQHGAAPRRQVLATTYAVSRRLRIPTPRIATARSTGASSSNR